MYVGSGKVGDNFNFARDQEGQCKSGKMSRISLWHRVVKSDIVAKIGKTAVDEVEALVATHFVMRNAGRGRVAAEVGWVSANRSAHSQTFLLKSIVRIHSFSIHTVSWDQ